MGRSLEKPIEALVKHEVDGERVFTIARYYDEFISPLEPKFSKYRLSYSRTVICPLHDDNDPSLGTVTSKDGTEIYNCFGCGRKGSIVDMHIFIEKKFKMRIIDESTAIYELATLFGIDPASLVVEEEVTSLKQVMRNRALKRAAINAKSKEFSITDYQLGIRTEGRGDVRILNDLMVQMLIANAKEKV